MTAIVQRPGARAVALLAGVSICAVVSALSTSARAADADASATSAVSNASTVEEVVVTAQKRTESLVNVPIAVTAVTGRNLEKAGVQSVADLASVVPGFHVDSSGAFFQPSIRGVGTAIAGAGASANVASYVDGVYKPEPLSNDFDFIDTDSIQVLKGPQGTLFGRNSTGGAILVTTRGPSLSSSQLDVRGGYGSFNTWNGAAFVATPINDKLAASLSLGAGGSDGWVTNLATGRHAAPSESFLGRAKLLFAPTDHVRFTLSGDEFRVDDPTLYAATSFNGWSDATFFGVPLSVGTPRQVNLTGPITHIVQGGSVVLKSEFEMPWATLTSYTAAQWESGREATNELAALYPTNGTLPSSPAVQVIVDNADWRWRERTYSEELDLGQSGHGPIDWVAGLFFFHDSTSYNPFNLGFYGPLGPGGLLSGAPFPWPASAYVNTGDIPLSGFTLPTDSSAVFADATYNIGDWHFTLGGRYSTDNVSETFTAYPQLGNGFTSGTFSGNHTFHSFTPRGVVRYSLTPDSNVYVSYSEGTKAGLYNSSGFLTQRTPLQPETLKDIEAGYKIAGHGWRFEAAAFHYDYRNLQVATYIGGSSFLQNAPAARIYGVDLHFQDSITDHIEVDLGGTWSHARYTDFKNAALQTFSPIFGVSNSTTDVSGGVMERSPEFTLTAGATYSTPLAGGELNLTANGNYQTGASFDFANTLRQSGYGLLNLRAAWTDPSSRWTLSVSGRNVLDKVYLVQVLPNAGGFGATYGEPANVTFQIRYAY